MAAFEAAAQMESLGFSREAVLRALQESGGDGELALSMLLEDMAVADSLNTADAKRREDEEERRRLAWRARKEAELAEAAEEERRRQWRARKDGELAATRKDAERVAERAALIPDPNPDREPAHQATSCHVPQLSCQHLGFLSR